MNECSDPNCENKAKSKGLCSYHYDQKRYFELKAKNPQALKDKAKRHRRTNSHRFWKAKADAETRGLVFSLSKEEFLALRKEVCYYCSEPLSPAGSGLDRIDNSKGYFLDNVVPACGRCNIARNTFFTIEEFKVMMVALIKWKNNQS